MQLGLEALLREGGYGAYSTHFDAIAEDGRFARLPLAAASSLMAKGYGYGAEGDALTAALMAAGARAARATRSSPRCTRWTSRSDSILMSHMGEGNWALARDDRPVRLIKRPLGIGGLGDPPTFLFQYATGPATLATLVSLGGERFRLLVARGRDPRHRRAAGARDALRVLPSRLGRARVHERVAAPRRPAPPGAQPRAPGARRGGRSASWPAWSSRWREPWPSITEPPTGAQFELQPRDASAWWSPRSAPALRSWTVGGAGAAGHASRRASTTTPSAARVLVPWPNRVRDGRYDVRRRRAPPRAHRARARQRPARPRAAGAAGAACAPRARRVSLSYELHAATRLSVRAGAERLLRARPRAAS